LYHKGSIGKQNIIHKRLFLSKAQTLEFMWPLTVKYAWKACCYCEKATVLSKNHMEHMKSLSHAWTIKMLSYISSQSDLAKLQQRCKKIENAQTAENTQNSQKITYFMESCIWPISRKMLVTKSYWSHILMELWMLLWWLSIEKLFTVIFTNDLISHLSLKI